MLKQMQDILIRLIALYIISRFPDRKDWENPHNMTRIFGPLLHEMGWFVRIGEGSRVNLYYGDSIKWRDLP